MKLSAILLAGGRSRRMGVDKATLLISGEPLWKRQLGVLRDVVPDAVWVSSSSAPSWCPPEIEVVTDGPPSCGPLSGIVAGLRRLQSSHLLVLAIDLPQMTPEHLRKLWSLARPGIGVLPWHGDYFEPLCAIYPAEASVAAEAALSNGEFALQDFAKRLRRESQARIYEPLPEEKPLYLNMNTPSDLPESMEHSRQAGKLT